jgi:hypothetical protein
MSGFTETCYQPIIGKELTRLLCGEAWIDSHGKPIRFMDDGTMEVYSEYHEKMIPQGGQYTPIFAAFRPGHDSYFGSSVTDLKEKGVCHEWDNEYYNFTDGPVKVYVGEHVFLSNLKRDYDLHPVGVFPVVDKDACYLYVLNGRGRDRKPIIFAQCERKGIGGEEWVEVKKRVKK